MKRFFCVIVSCVLLITFVFSMCACQQTPDYNAVTSKSDGSFDANVIRPATEANDSTSVEFSESKEFSETFSSTDGTVEFTMNINDYATFREMPVVEVVPHYLTEDDAKRVAKVLFGDTTFFEAEPEFDAEYSKQDVLNYVTRWAPYTSTEKLLELYGPHSPRANNLEETADTVKRAVSRFSEMYETVPDENPHELCKWSFQPSSHYTYSREDLTGKDLSRDNEMIGVQVEVDGIPYMVGFSKRDQNDFKLNYIYAYPHTYYSPLGIDSNIFRAQLCRTEKPTDIQLAELTKKAQDMLDRMELGDWFVDECNVQTNYVGDYTEYIVNIKATPIFGKVPAIRRPQLTYLKSKTSYASNYYLTDANFQFSVDGKLLLFEMYSTIDIKRVLNDDVAILSLDELIGRAKSHLTLSDYNDYGLSGEYLQFAEQQAGEDFVCMVEICELECGMIRVRVPDTDASYYYVPGFIIAGTIDYQGKNSGKLYASSGETIGVERIVPLVAFNAVDGSVIQLQNE